MRYLSNICYKCSGTGMPVFEETSDMTKREYNAEKHVYNSIDPLVIIVPRLLFGKFILITADRDTEKKPMYSLHKNLINYYINLYFFYPF